MLYEKYVSGNEASIFKQENHSTLKWGSTHEPLKFLSCMYYAMLTLGRWSRPEKPMNRHLSCAPFSCKLEPLFLDVKGVCQRISQPIPSESILQLYLHPQAVCLGSPLRPASEGVVSCIHLAVQKLQGRLSMAIGLNERANFGGWKNTMLEGQTGNLATLSWRSSFFINSNL